MKNDACKVLALSFLVTAGTAAPGSAADVAQSRDAQPDFLGKGGHTSALRWQLHGDTVEAPRIP